MSNSLLLAGSMLGAGVFSWFAVGQLIGFLVKRNIIDLPNDRTLHRGAVPRGGGLVIVGVLLLALILMALLSSRYAFFGGLLGVVLAWAGLSWQDDRVDLSPKVRISVHLLFSVLTVCAFGWVGNVNGISLAWIGAPITVVGVLWMANLYNFMDGIDGLAASQAIIASITLAFWFYIVGDSNLAVVCAVLASSCYGFLLWNWQPAKIFMGDVGSITLGAFFATLIIIGVTRYQIPVLSLVLIFALFVGDASTTILRRALNREKIWLPHRSHYYQRLAKIGISHAIIVFGAIVIMLLCSLIATLSMVYRDMIGIAVISAISLIFCAALLVRWLEGRVSNTT